MDKFREARRAARRHMIGVVVALVFLGLLVLAGWVPLGILLAKNDSNGGSTSSSSSSAPVEDAAAAAARVGAASLNLEQCGCASSGAGTPSCGFEHAWVVNKTSNPLDNSFTIVTQRTSDRYVIRGTYVLRVVNSGSSTTSLTSVYVGLEMPVPNGGNAPGPSGKNWLTVASAAMSAAPQCGTTANICSNGANFTARTTSGSNLVVLDPLGNSIVVGASGQPYPIAGPRDNDNDTHVNEDSGDINPTTGLACDGSHLGVDDDNDTRIDEDGVCQDAVTFLVSYAFEVTPQQAVLLGGRQVRVNVLATFLANAERGATCVTDTDCSGGITSAERNARTVQTRQTFTFPTTCADRCSCVQLVDVTSSTSYNVPSGLLALLSNAPHVTLDPVLSPLTYCYTPSVSSYGVSTTVSAVCPVASTETTETIVTNTATLDDFDLVNYGTSGGCEGLIKDSPSIATLSFQCNQTVFPSPSVEPTPTTVPPYQPPPVGKFCTLSAGTFTGSGTCNNISDTTICTQRRNETVSAPCLRQACTEGLLGSVFFAFNRMELALIAPLSGHYQVNVTATTGSLFDDLLFRLISENTGQPGFFTNNTRYTQAMLSDPAGAFITSARNLARQFAMAQWNIAMTRRYDPVSRYSELGALVFAGNECGGLPAWMNTSVSLFQLAGFTRFAIGLVGGSYHSNATLLVQQCESAIDSSNPLCAQFNTFRAPLFKDPATGVTLASILASAWDLYNVGYEACKTVTECLVVAPA